MTEKKDNNLKKRFKAILRDFDPATPPPKIEPVPEGIKRPTWSVMIPAYNCAKYLEKTLESVLAQDPGPQAMQIMVVDDCSFKDNPEAVVLRTGKSRVEFVRNQKNEGATCTFNNCLRLSRGELVHVLHGDDYVLSGFYEMVQYAMHKNPSTGMTINRCFIVNERDEVEKLIDREIKTSGPHYFFPNHLYCNQFFTPGLVFRRTAIEKHGGFRPDLVHCADWEITARIYSQEGGVYLNEPKACYRLYEGNETSRLAKTGENLRDYVKLCLALEKLGLPISRDRFLSQVIDQAKQSAVFFKAIKNDAARRAYRRLEKQIYHLLSWKNKVKKNLQRITEKIQIQSNRFRIH